MPLPRFFTYVLPDSLAAGVEAGCRVIVPFGKRKYYSAIVCRVHGCRPEGYALKEVCEVVDAAPVILPGQLNLWQWVADYYLCAIGEVYGAALPARMKAEANALEEIRKQVGKSVRQKKKPLSEEPRKEEPPVVLNRLTAPQQLAFDQIKDVFGTKDVCLLHGVTSSGKTEIYIHLIEQTLRAGRQVLYLLPEIALTTQITDRLGRVFGNRLAIYHSMLSDGEREEIWKKQLSDAPYDIILGVRSSVFLPFRRLGLVIVDEEHENTYKQQEPAPRYHARSVAIVLASMSGAKTLLGSATPSIESWYNATEAGKYGLVSLAVRYREIRLPEIVPVDLHTLRHKRRMKGSFSPELLEVMREALDRGEQVMLFQNRRGFAPMMECHTCGWIPRCVNCDVTLTHHKAQHLLVCHYCGHSMAEPTVCPACGSEDMRSLGAGTERVEDEVRSLFPDVAAARMDLDTTRTKHAHERILSDFSEGKIRILIGTQMISKGLDFGNVSVVGILNADLMLSYPDFRAYERAYQLMAQVAGRAGRKNRQGLVVLQTADVEHPIITQVRHNDYRGMVEMQLAERSMFRYPPYYRIIYVCLKHRDAVSLDYMAQVVASRLRAVFGEQRVMGPAAPPVARVQRLFIRKIMLKFELSAKPAHIRELLLKLQDSLPVSDGFRSLRLYYDVDPV